MKLVTCNNRDTLRVDKQIEYLNPEKDKTRKLHININKSKQLLSHCKLNVSKRNFKRGILSTSK